MVNYKNVLWDAKGPYWLDETSGKKSYIAPIQASQSSQDPKLVAWANTQGANVDASGHQVSTGRPSGGFLRSGGQWNGDTGDWDQPINWSNLMSLGVGGVMAAPLVAGAFGAGAGGTAAGASGGAGIYGPMETALTAGKTVSAAASPSLWSWLAPQGISAVTQLIGAHQTASANDRAAQLQTDAQRYAADQTAKSSADQIAYLQAKDEQERRDKIAADMANYGQFTARERRLGNLGDLIGASPREIPPPPSYVTDTGTSANSSGAPGAPSGSAPSAFLKGLLDSGMDPEQAATQTNTKFNLQTGSQAKYYAPSPDTSGKAVVGLPDSYISQEPNGWQVTQRSGGGAAPAAKPKPAPYVSAALTAQPATLNSFVKTPALTGLW